MNSVVATYSLMSRPVAERKLLTLFNTLLQTIKILLTEIKIVNLSEYTTKVTKQSHVAHIDSVENLLPRLTLRTKVFPSLLRLIDSNSACLYQLVNRSRKSMSQENSILNSHISILILCYLIRSQLTEFGSNTALQDRRHICLTAILENVVRQLRQRIVCTEHNLLVNLVKLTRVLLSKVLTTRMLRSSYHNDLRVKSHVEVISKSNSPIKCCLKIIGQSFIDSLFHNLSSSFALHPQRKYTVLVDECILAINTIITLHTAVTIVRRFSVDGRSSYKLQSSQRIAGVRITIHEVLNNLVRLTSFIKLLISVISLVCIRNLRHSYPP